MPCRAASIALRSSRTPVRPAADRRGAGRISIDRGDFALRAKSDGSLRDPFHPAVGVSGPLPAALIQQRLVRRTDRKSIREIIFYRDFGSRSSLSAELVFESFPYPHFLNPGTFIP